MTIFWQRVWMPSSGWRQVGRRRRRSTRMRRRRGGPNSLSRIRMAPGRTCARGPEADLYHADTSRLLLRQIAFSCPYNVRWSHVLPEILDSDGIGHCEVHQDPLPSSTECSQSHHKPRQRDLFPPLPSMRTAATFIQSSSQFRTHMISVPQGWFQPVSLTENVPPPSPLVG